MANVWKASTTSTALLSSHMIRRPFQTKIFYHNYILINHRLCLPRISCYFARFKFNNHHCYILSHSYLSTSAIFFDLDEKSKVEQTLEHLRQHITATPENKALVPVEQKSLWRRFVDECKHYWHGSRLLAIDIKVTSRLLWQVLRGRTLTRRERRQLTLTMSDIFRLVPFLVITVIPFLEFSLPVLLKLFPNMLPSTFQEQSRLDEKHRRLLQGKLEMARFLQDTLEQQYLERKEKGSTNATNSAGAFAEFTKRIRTEGGFVSNDELLRFSKLFQDELTLDALDRNTLRALCRIVGLRPVGTAEMLRVQLRFKLRELKADDKLIQHEGLDALTTPEMQAACRARGMRSVGLSEQALRNQLSQWLELSLNEHVPPSLLLLSRALYLPEDIPFTNRLNVIMKQLPESVAQEARLKLAEFEGDKIDNKSKLEIIKSIEESLKREREEERLRRKEEKEKEQAKREKEKADAEEKTKPEVVMEDKTPVIDLSHLKDVDLTAVTKTALDLSKSEAVESLKTIDSAELKAAIDNVSGGLALRGHLNELKEEVQDYKDDVEAVQAIVTLSGKAGVMENKAARRLRERLEQMISGLDNKLTYIENLQKLQKGDAENVDPATTAGDARVPVIHLMNALRKLGKISDADREAKVLEILKAFDADRDGAIELDQAIEVLDILSRENVKLTAEQIRVVTDLLDKMEEKEEISEKTTQEKSNLAVEDKTVKRSIKNSNSDKPYFIQSQVNSEVSEKRKQL